MAHFAWFANKKPSLGKDDIALWSEINASFHGTIIDGAGSRTVADTIAQNNHLPFASSDSIIIGTDHLEEKFQKIKLAHLHHQLVYQAISTGESARAEMLMREHAYIGVRYGAVLGMPDALERRSKVPASSLTKHPSA